MVAKFIALPTLYIRSSPTFERRMTLLVTMFARRKVPILFTSCNTWVEILLKTPPFVFISLITL